MTQTKTIKIDVDAKDGIKQVDQLKKGVKDTSKAASGTKGAFGKMKAGVKGLSVAFKALGIGLIVAAFVKLKEIFSGNIETARKFEVVSARLSAAFDVIRDRAEQFIKSLIKMKNPFKAFKDAFTGTTAEIKEETKAMAELTKQLQAVRDEEREMILERAKANRIIASSRLLAEDETKSIQERLVALKAAVAEEQRVAQLELDTQQKKVDALQAIIDLGKSSEEDMIELASERARLIDLETSSTQRQLRVTRELNTMERELVASQKKDAEKGLEFTAKKFKSEDDFMKKQMANMDALAKNSKKNATEEIEITKMTQEQKEQILRGALGKISGLVSKDSKKGKKVAKALAIIDTFAAANKALAQGGIMGVVAAAGIVATGIANVKAITDQKLPDGDDGGGGDGPTPDVPSPTGGIGGAIPNLENITGTATGELQPVQAFVVETDISNAQALQEELDIQSTL
tara:strand:- start:37 stop:1416 length:1380 start_codon:yes stop_codon:yes gene_type:complete